MELYNARGTGDDLSSVESIITASKKLRTQISELGKASSPELVRAGQIQVEIEALKPRLSKLAKSSVTDVKIRAGGEEHRLRDAQTALIALARDAATGVARSLEHEAATARSRGGEAWDTLSLLDDQLASLRRSIFDEAANERQSLFL